MTFTHDVLVCFGRGRVADDALDLTQWSEKLIALLDAEMNPPAYVQEPRAKVTIALEDSAATRPALLLVLLSPPLVQDKERLGEIERFRASADADGRTVEHSVIATIMPSPLPHEPNAALDWLLQHGSRPLNSEGFYDPDAKQPLALDAVTPALASLAGEIRNKLKALKRRMPDRFAPPSPPTNTGPIQPESAVAPIAPLFSSPGIPDLPQVYLSSASNLQRWTEARTALKSIAVVNPAEMGATDFNLAKRRERDDLRRAFLLRCKGLVLIRANVDDRTAVLVSEALDDIRELRQAEANWKTPLWVLIDWVDDNGPALQEVRPPRVSALQPNWTDGVRRTLGL